MTDFELEERAKQKLSEMDKDPVSSFDGKLLLNTRFFFVKTDCLSLENIESVDDLDRCIDILQSELSDLEIYCKYKIGIKPQCKKELEELTPEEFDKLKKHEIKSALKIAISRYERRRHDFANRQTTERFNYTKTKTQTLQGRLLNVYADYPDFEKDYSLLKENGFFTELDISLKWEKSKKCLAEYFDSIKIKNRNWQVLEVLFSVKDLKNSLSSNGNAYTKKTSKDFETLQKLKNTSKGE